MKPIARPSSRGWTTSLPNGRRRLARCTGVPLVAYHNSWAYFARRFRLDFVGFIEPKPGVPPSPAHLAAHDQDHACAQASASSCASRTSPSARRLLAERPAQRSWCWRLGRRAAGGARLSSLFDTNIAALLAAAATR